MGKVEGFFYIKYNNFTLNTSFSFCSKNITALIGESGSGKTTFLKCICGIIEPTKSYLKINNNIIQNSRKNIFIKINKRNIGYVFQTPCLFPNKNVIQNIKFGIKNKNMYMTEEKILKILNLEKLKNKNIIHLSGGEKQRISIAQIILMNPKLILLDEPFSSQDINTKNILINLLKNINKTLNIPIIYASHDIKNIKNLTDNVIYLNNGKIKNFL